MSGAFGWLHDAGNQLLSLIIGVTQIVGGTPGDTLIVGPSGELEQTPARLPAQSPYYVSTAGNDSTGTGSLVNPWRTITHALNIVSGLDGGGNVIRIGLIRTSNPVNYAGAQPGGFPTGCPSVVTFASDASGNRITTPDGGGVTLDDSVSGFSCFDILPSFSRWSFDHVTFKPLLGGEGVSHDGSFIYTEFEGCLWDASVSGDNAIAHFGATNISNPGFAVYISNATSTNSIKGNWQSSFNDFGNPGCICGFAGTVNLIGTPTLGDFSNITGFGSVVSYACNFTGTFTGPLGNVGYGATIINASNTPPGSGGYSIPSGSFLVVSGALVFPDPLSAYTNFRPTTITTNYTVGANDTEIIANGAGTITLILPTASSFTGRTIRIKTIANQTVVSNASNVVPLAGGAAGTAILAATAGKWAELQSDGSNWIIMAAN